MWGSMAIRYTSLADPLLDYINEDLAVSTGGASSLLTPINYNADLFADEAKFFTGNYGFDGYIGVPGLQGSNAQQAAAQYNVAWESVDPSLNPAARALTSGASVIGVAAQYGVNLLLQDTIPLVFSYPVLPTTLDSDGSDFEVVLNDGSVGIKPAEKPKKPTGSRESTPSKKKRFKNKKGPGKGREKSKTPSPRSAANKGNTPGDSRKRESTPIVKK